MRYLRCTNIDTKTVEADSDKEAVEKFKDMIKYEVAGGPGSPIKDYYLCKIVAVHAEWNEFPRGFTVISNEQTSIDSDNGRSTE